MDKGIKDKWVKALRSGTYTQSFRSLRTDDGFCCLGVLAAEMGMEIEPDGHGVLIPGEGRHSYKAIWDIVSESHSRQLATMNDDGLSFTEIADQIEKTL